MYRKHKFFTFYFVLVSDSVEQTPTADQDAQKQKPSITEESSDKQDAATTSSETNAKDVEENKDTDEDVIMLDTDSTDEEKDESTKKSTTNLGNFFKTYTTMFICEGVIS